jgi:hypothetical protein
MRLVSSLQDSVPPASQSGERQVPGVDCKSARSQKITSNKITSPHAAMSSLFHIARQRRGASEDLDDYCEMMADSEFRRFSGGKLLRREEAEKSLRSILIGQRDWLRPKPMGFRLGSQRPGRWTFVL